MFTKLIHSITKKLIKFLEKRGVDIFEENPFLTPSEDELIFNENNNKLINLQGEISLKRAEIIENQKNLLQIIEPALFSNLSESSDNWERNGVTKLWFDKVNEINKLIQDHQNLINEFEEMYTKTYK